MKIRSKVFETNSSSCHSLSIIESDYDSIPNDGTITLTGGEYGWEYEKYTAPTEKANYVATQLYMLRNWAAEGYRTVRY